MLKKSAVMFMAIGVLFFCAGRSWCLGVGGSVESGAYHEAGQYTEQDSFGDAKAKFVRNSLKIPTDYGNLVGVTGGRSGSTLWFQNESGTIRNVVINNNDLVVINRSGQVGQ